MDTEELTIDHLELDLRTSNVLRNYDILTVNDVCRKTEKELLSLPNFGRKCLNVLGAALAQHRRKLGDMRPVEYDSRNEASVIAIGEVPNRTDGLLSVHVGGSYVLLSRSEARAFAAHVLRMAG